VQNELLFHPILILDWYLLLQNFYIGKKKVGKNFRLWEKVFLSPEALVYRGGFDV